MGVGFQSGAKPSPHPHPSPLLRFKCALALEGEGIYFVTQYNYCRSSIYQLAWILLGVINEFAYRRGWCACRRRP